MAAGRRVGRQIADALAYAAVLTGSAFVAGSALSFALGGGLVGAKYLLFFVGFGMLGYATFLLWPTPPWRGDDGRSSGAGGGRFGGGGLLPIGLGSRGGSDSDPGSGGGAGSGSESKPGAGARAGSSAPSRRSPGERAAQDKPFHRIASRLLPPGIRLPPEQRFSAGAKLLLAAVAVLATSFVMEAVFNVTY